MSKLVLSLYIKNLKLKQCKKLVLPLSLIGFNRTYIRSENFSLRASFKNIKIFLASVFCSNTKSSKNCLKRLNICNNFRSFVYIKQFIKHKVKEIELSLY